MLGEDVFWHSLFWYGLSWSIVFAILVYIILWTYRNPRTVKDWAESIGIFYQWCKSNIRKRKRSKLASTISKSINNERQMIDFESDGVIAKQAKVVFIPENVEEDVIVDDGVAEVAIHYDSNTPRNFIHATSLFVRKVLLPTLKSYVDKEFMDVVDLITIKGILKSTRKEGVRTIFITEFLAPIMSDPSRKKAREVFRRIKELEKRGILTRIFLREANKIEKNICDVENPQELDCEIQSFSVFLEEVITREKGENSDLSFESRNIRMHIVFVGSILTKLHGIRPYIERIKSSFGRGIKSVYVIGVGDVNVNFCELVANCDFENAIEVHRLGPYHCKGYRGKPAICIPLVNLL